MKHMSTWTVTVAVAVAALALHPFTRAAETRNRLEHMIVVEPEHCVDKDGARPTRGFADWHSDHIFVNRDEGASNGEYLTPVKSPWRIKKPLPTVVARKQVDIPVGGRWYGHVRYKITPKKLGNMDYLEAARTVGHFHFFGPFEIEIGDQRVTVGENQEQGAAYRWDRFEVDLDAGATDVQFLMDDLAGPDVLVLTPVPDYTPELSDFTGPVWLRFKVEDGAPDPFFVKVTCHFNPYEVRDHRLRARPAGWLFREAVVDTEDKAKELRGKPDELLTSGQWSPWVRTYRAHRKHFYAEVDAKPGAGQGSGVDRLRGYPNIRFSYQAATRPEEVFVAHEGWEYTGAARGAMIFLPTQTGPEAMKGVKSVSEWADDRLEMVEGLNLEPGQGPERIRVTTMNDFPRTPREIEVFLQTAQRVGLTGVDMGQRILDPEELWSRIADMGFTSGIAHHLALLGADQWRDLPPEPPEGQAAQETIDEYWYGKAMERIHRLWDKRPEVQRKMIDIANLVDEPGPLPSHVWANCIPLVRQAYRDFLRRHGVTADFLGYEAWDEVLMTGYVRRASKRTATRYLRHYRIDFNYYTPEGPVSADELFEFEKLPVPEDDKAPLYRIRVPILRDRREETTLLEKRRYYWSQRFRSYFTRHFYGQSAKAVEKLAGEGWFPSDVKTTPNFQASPMMLVQLWDGGLNLFEWARANTSNALMVEDWIGGPYRVALGQAMQNAAARKHGQKLCHLIVADKHFRRRYLASLAQGVVSFIDYLYGPYGVIGPGWADRPEGVRNRAEMMRWTRRCEDDLLASKLRPADTALLIANTADINTKYYTADSVETGLKFGAAENRPMFRRAGIYSALLDGGVPVEVVSEAEILEDNALNRYKALYVADPHVLPEVQRTIREWVRNGGVLWADHAALARDQFDQPVNIMNEVFGLADRGALPDPATPPDKDADAKRIVVADGELLDGVAFDGSLYQPAWRLDSARALGRFEDDSPALIANDFGKGAAILVGCSSLALSHYAVQSTEMADFPKARRVVTLGAQVAGAGRHCTVSRSAVPTFVRDGDEQTVLVALNGTPDDVRNVEFRLNVPRRVDSALDGRGETVQFEQADGEVRFSRNIGFDDGDIIVFRLR